MGDTFTVPCRADLEPDGRLCDGTVQFDWYQPQGVCGTCGAWWGRFSFSWFVGLAGGTSRQSHANRPFTCAGWAVRSVSPVSPVRLATDGYTAEADPPAGSEHGDTRESTGPSLEDRINAPAARRLTVAGLTAALVATTLANSCPPTEATAAPAPAYSVDVDAALAARTADHADRARTRVPAVMVRLTGHARAQPVRHKVRAQPRRTAEHRTRAARHVQHRPRPAPRARTVRTPAGVRGRAALVVAYAYRQIGKPYVFGAAGPRSFDCSGLTMRAYAQAGIVLPHKASRQRGHTVSAAQARPGDLVKWGGYHIGIYVGDGWVIHAPKKRDWVRKAHLWGAYRFVRLL